MDYAIIDIEHLLIGDGTEVRLYDHTGKRIYENIPSRKMFDETAYIYPPTTVEGESFEAVLQEYLDNRREANGTVQNS